MATKRRYPAVRKHIHTGQNFDERVFWGGSAAERRKVAEGFLFLVMTKYPAAYPVSLGIDAITVDMREWPDDLEFPSGVWTLFRSLGVKVED